MAPVLDSGLPLSLTLKPTRIMLGITVEQVNTTRTAHNKNKYSIHLCKPLKVDYCLFNQNSVSVAE